MSATTTIRHCCAPVSNPRTGTGLGQLTTKAVWSCDQWAEKEKRQGEELKGGLMSSAMGWLDWLVHFWLCDNADKTLSNTIACRESPDKKKNSTEDRPPPATNWNGKSDNHQLEQRTTPSSDNMHRDFPAHFCSFIFKPQLSIVQCFVLFHVDIDALFLPTLAAQPRSWRRINGDVIRTMTSFAPSVLGGWTNFRAFSFL